jgi:hypothetical protein
MSKRGKAKGGVYAKREKKTQQGKVKEVVEKSNGVTYTKNIVYKEILT